MGLKYTVSCAQNKLYYNIQCAHDTVTVRERVEGGTQVSFWFIFLFYISQIGHDFRGYSICDHLHANVDHGGDQLCRKMVLFYFVVLFCCLCCCCMFYFFVTGRIFVFKTSESELVGFCGLTCSGNHTVECLNVAFLCSFPKSCMRSFIVESGKYLESTSMIGK